MFVYILLKFCRVFESVELQNKKIEEQRLEIIFSIELMEQRRASLVEDVR